MNGADVRVVQGSHRACFAFEALAELRIGRKGRRQDFNGHVAAESRVAGAIYLAHAASANGGTDLVRAETSTGIQHVAN